MVRSPSPTALVAAVLGVAVLAGPQAAAQETVDIGILRNDEITVVQDVLYPKKGRFEIGGHLGWMPFDPLVTTPNAQISLDQHLSETVSVSVLVGGGYGLKTARYAELEGPAYGIAPYAFRYLASALVGVGWAPIYGKMSFGGTRVVHYDVYGALRAGGTLEQSVIPDGGLTVAPTLSPGIGARFFVNDTLAVRAEIRDDLLVEYRKLTSNWNFKQNAGITVGVTAMLGGK